MDFGGAAGAQNGGNANVDLMSWWVLNRLFLLISLHDAEAFCLSHRRTRMKLSSCFTFSICPMKNRYMKIPPVSRFYLTSAFMTTAACAVDIISPLTLYFNYDLVFHHGQFWRLITPYLFFGVFSVDFLFHMYFLVRSRYCFLKLYCHAAGV
jgi:Der1-like family